MLRHQLVYHILPGAFQNRDQDDHNPGSSCLEEVGTPLLNEIKVLQVAATQDLAQVIQEAASTFRSNILARLA